MIMSFIEFIHKNSLENEATSNRKIHQIVSFLCLSDVGIYLKDNTLTTVVRILYEHPTKGTYWATYSF